MVLRRKLPTDIPTPAGVPDAAPQQAAPAAPVTPPPITSFDNFDNISDAAPQPVRRAAVGDAPHPMGGHKADDVPPVPPPAAPAATPAGHEAVTPPPLPNVTAAAPSPVQTGGLKRRAPAATPPEDMTPSAPQAAVPTMSFAPIQMPDPLVVDPFAADETPRSHAAPDLMPTPTSTFVDDEPALADEGDDLSWMSPEPTPVEVLPDTPDDDAWELGVEAAAAYQPDRPEKAEAKSSVYGNLGREDDPFAAAPASPKAEKQQRPWEQKGGNVPPPTLPKSPFAGAKAEGHGRTLITLGLLGVLAVGAYMFISNRDAAVDAMSRWTGTLSNVSQNVADTAGESAEGLIPTDEVISAKDVGIAPLQPAFGDKGPVGAAAGNLPAPANLSDMGSDTTVDFLDVRPGQQNDPIVADGSEPMPEEVSAFAALHQAIMEKRAARDAKKAVQKNLDTGEPIPAALADEVKADKPRTKEDVDNELDAYRRVLASIDNPALKPSPSEFFENPSAFDGDLLPPPGLGMPQPKPTKTPEGNPIIASEVQRQVDEKQVRTLADFEDALLKQPERQIRIPSKVKPRLATSGFPGLEILSLIPTYGLLANADNRQGVLLIGDTFEGWELIGVYDTYAEFQSGDRKHVMTLK